MHILVLNSGSSSLKFSLYESTGPTPTSRFEGEATGLGTPAAKAAFRSAAGEDLTPDSGPLASSADAVAFLLRCLTLPNIPAPDALGYRVVHPGPTLHDHQRITPAVLDALRDAARFAPLHDPAAVSLIETMQSHFPALPHFACFDTVFHDTLPPEAFTYPIPAEYAAQGVRRYGFHGLSCESVLQQLRATPNPLPRRLAIAHLGGGSSVTAVLDGQSVDNSMGLTPTGGVVMATRPGDLDPGLLLYLLRQTNNDLAGLEAMLNHNAGLAALAPATKGDMRALRTAAASSKDAQAAPATLALRIFTRSITKALGSYLALLGGLDAIIFTGGIGEHDPQSRVEILAPLATLGVTLDPALNEAPASGLRRLTTDTSSVTAFIVPAEEDLIIAQHVARLYPTAHS